MIGLMKIILRFVPLLKSNKMEVAAFYLGPEDLPNRDCLGYMDESYVERLPKTVNNAVSSPEHRRVHKEPPKEPEETLNCKMDYLRKSKNKDLRRIMKKVAVQKREHRHELLPPVCDKFSKEYILRVGTRLAVARLADVAQGHKLLSDEHRDLKREAKDPGLKDTWGNDAWGVVLEHMGRQMLDPGATGTPDHIKNKLKDLFKAYASYKTHFRQCFPRRMTPLGISWA